MLRRYVTDLLETLWTVCLTLPEVLGWTKAQSLGFRLAQDIADTVLEMQQKQTAAAVAAAARASAPSSPHSTDGLSQRRSVGRSAPTPPPLATEIAVADLCSGAGGPVPIISSRLRDLGVPAHFMLTDLFPNLEAMQRASTRDGAKHSCSRPHAASCARALAVAIAMVLEAESAGRHLAGWASGSAAPTWRTSSSGVVSGRAVVAARSYALSRAWFLLTPPPTVRADSISYVAEPVSATSCHLDVTLRTLFAALHQFPPAAARAVLAGAVSRKQASVAWRRGVLRVCRAPYAGALPCFVHQLSPQQHSS
jgi:hypothetical protein